MDFIQIPKQVFMSKDISHGAALLYGVIYCASLSGPSYRSDESYSKELDCTIRTISRWIGELRIAGFISIRKTYKNNSPIVDKRYITPLVTLKSTIAKIVHQEGLTIDKNIPNDRQKCHATVDKSGGDNIQVNIQDNIQGETSSPKEVIKAKPKKKNPLDVVVGTIEKNYKGVKYFDYEEPTEKQCIEAMKAMGNRMNPVAIGESYWADKGNKEWTRSYGKVKIKSWPNDMWSDFKKGWIKTGEKKW